MPVEGVLSNRRGPSANCGCCKPPCTCLAAKDAFRFLIPSISLSGSSFSLASQCRSGTLGGSFSASATINYDDDFCGESAGSFVCPTIRSHYFGSFPFVHEGGTTTTSVVGRFGSNLSGGCFFSPAVIQCMDSPPVADPINDIEPCITAVPDGYGGFDLVYGGVRAPVSASVGISFSCRDNEPAYDLYVTAQYSIYYGTSFPGGPIAVTAPAAPTGWTRTPSGAGVSALNFLYVRNDGLATLSFNRASDRFSNHFCNGVFVAGIQPIYTLSAFTTVRNSSTVTLDYPFDPAGIFSGITGTA